MTPTKWVLHGICGVGRRPGGLGYAMGGSGRFTLQNALDDTRGKLDIADARGAAARSARQPLQRELRRRLEAFRRGQAGARRVRERFQNIGKNAAAGVAAALEHIEEGQRLAGKLDQAANSKANDALEAISVASRSNSSLLQNRCRQLHRHLALRGGIRRLGHDDRFSGLDESVMRWLSEP